MRKGTGIIILFVLSLLLPALGPVIIHPMNGTVIQAETLTQTPLPNSSLLNSTAIPTQTPIPNPLIYVSGHIFDRDSSEPIEAAVVHLERLYAETDRLGCYGIGYLFPSRPASITLSVKAPGYQHTIETMPLPLNSAEFNGPYLYRDFYLTRSKPNPHQIAGKIKVQMYNFIRSTLIQMITPRFRLYNTGAHPIKLSTVKIRYYYTVDGVRPQDFQCLDSSVGRANITGTFIKMHTNPGYYLEIGFTGNAGSLAAGTGIDIQTRFAKTGDSEYRQPNDYSFNSSATGYVDWAKTTGYIAGALKWGKEP